MKRNAIKIVKWKKTLYFISLLTGVLLSVVSVLLAYKFENNPLVSYFLGFSSSLIITVVFACLLELISLRDQNEKRKKQRLTLLLPVIESVKGMLFRTAVFASAVSDNAREYRYEDFDDLLKKAFDYYCAFVKDPTKKHETIELSNRYKYETQHYYIEPLVSFIDIILNNRYALMADEVMNESEISILEGLKEISVHMGLPDLDGIKTNDDCPTCLENDETNGLARNSDREKYYMLVELFVNTLEDSVQTIEELEPLENLEFKLRQIRDNRVVIETVNPRKQA